MVNVKSYRPSTENNELKDAQMLCKFKESAE